jgi:glutathione S-transferase
MDENRAGLKGTPKSSCAKNKIRRAAMKLYDLRTGTNTRRVRIFLAEKGVKLPIVEVDMMKGENKSPDYLAKNPMGTMPLLELDDGTQLAESVAICRYIEELHPEPPLFGATPIERALIEMWNRRMELELLIPIIDNFVHSSAFYKERLSQVADIAHRGHMHAQDPHDAVSTSSFSDVYHTLNFLKKNANFRLRLAERPNTI